MIQLRYIAVAPNDLLLYHGALTVEIVLGGTISASVLDVVKLVDQSVAEHKMKAPIIVIDGSVPDERDADDVLQVVQVMRKKNYTVIGKCSGTVMPRWFNDCSKTVAMITNDDWLGFSCDEVQYVPTNNEPLSEPWLGAANQALKTICLNVARPAAELFSFLSAATFAWQVIIPPKHNYAVVIVKEQA